MNNQHHLHHHQQQRQYCYNGQQHTNQRFGGGGGGGGGGGSNRPYNPYASAQKQRRLFQEGMVSAFANKSITMVNVYLTKRLFWVTFEAAWPSTPSALSNGELILVKIRRDKHLPNETFLLCTFF